LINFNGIIGPIADDELTLGNPPAFFARII